MMTKIPKAYVSYDKEEAWLNEMAAKGLMLVHYSWCTYFFQEGIPGEYTYRLELLENLPSHPESQRYLDFMRDAGLLAALAKAEATLAAGNITPEKWQDAIVTTLAGAAARLAAAVVTGEEKSYSAGDRRRDAVLTGRRWGYPIMLGCWRLSSG